MRPDEGRRHEVAVQVHPAQRLPAVWVVDRTQVERDARVHRQVGRCVARVVGVGDAGRPTRSGAELVRPVRVAEVEQRLRCHVADSRRRRRVHRVIVRVMPETRHQRVEHGRLARGDEVDGGAVGAKADRRLLVLERALPRGPAERTSEPCPDRLRVVCRPSVEDRRMDDRERTRDHRWPERRPTYSLEDRLVPPENDVVARQRGTT